MKSINTEKLVAVINADVDTLIEACDREMGWTFDPDSQEEIAEKHGLSLDELIVLESVMLNTMRELHVTAVKAADHASATVVNGLGLADGEANDLYGRVWHDTFDSIQSTLRKSVSALAVRRLKQCAGR